MTPTDVPDVVAVESPAEDPSATTAAALCELAELKLEQV
jgi:hypothetical protein